MEAFLELSIIISITTLIAIFIKIIKQPLIVGYIISGIIVGPHVFNLLNSQDQIDLFSKIGITTLLFIVGLSLNPKVIKELGKVSLIIGLGQVFFTTLIGFIIAILLGIDRIASLYISIALTLSSTIIILKLLSDKGDINKLYGKIAIGLLLVQDIIATLILIIISALSNPTDSSIFLTISSLLLKGICLAAIIYLASEYLIPFLTKFSASSQELLFLFSLAWGFGLGSIFYILGFSIEIGALIAGVTLSLTPYSYEIGSRMKPVRDFFVVLFFIFLGSQLVIDNIGTLILPAVIFSAFVLIGNPIIVIILMNLLGYKRRVGFQAGLTVAQISEFSLILATLGFNLGHLSREVLSLITLVGLVTIAGSTYFILYSDDVYPYVEKILRFFELRKNNRQKLAQSEEKFDLILFGYNRVGEDFVNVFRKMEKPFVVVDFNPESINRLHQNQIPYKYGDAQDVEFLNELNLKQVKLCVSTMPDLKTNLLLTSKIKRDNPQSIIIVISHNVKDAKELYLMGATYVIMPHYLGARYASNMIGRLGLSKNLFEEEKERHLKFLEQKQINHLV